MLGGRESHRRADPTLKRVYQAVAFLLIAAGIYSAFMFTAKPESNGSGVVAGVRDNNVINPSQIANNLRGGDIVETNQCVEGVINQNNFEKCRDLAK